ncbi:hypothetical protein S245_029334 [Arachis hypogaea]
MYPKKTVSLFKSSNQTNFVNMKEDFTFMKTLILMKKLDSVQTLHAMLTQRLQISRTMVVYFQEPCNLLYGHIMTEELTSDCVKVKEFNDALQIDLSKQIELSVNFKKVIF